jgi:hypothetical protein
VTLFLLSLVASWVLFKLLDSRATIKRKGWSAGGAIAGFLIILFLSWRAVQPTLTPRSQILPTSMPKGFNAVSLPESGIALAIPNHWERKQTPVLVSLMPKQQKPNSADAKYFDVDIRDCSELSVMSDSDIQDLQKPFQQMFGLLHFRGPSVTDSYLGHQTSTTPVSAVFPGALLSPSQATDFTLNMVSRQIYDERNGRCITLIYPDSESGRLIASTLNITSPLFEGNGK